MRLKKIKLAGFKSFVDPTTIPFPGEMTAIVGPNGCGKSNVIDAVRWVLGESSAKNLRGDAMTDVIFNGSTARKAVSQCSVELIFDNSSGRIAGEFASYIELSIKRVVTKEAVSSYLLNGSKCRKRDITDLFLGTGLGPRSYAIIEQGMISKLIESRPQELRVFIEEAAGISKYKERRRETETRIKHTKENLSRLDDVRGELAEQIEKLRRQAAAASRYKELKGKEREVKAQLAAIKWVKQSEYIIATEEKIALKKNELEDVIAQQRGDEHSILKFKTRQQDLQQVLADVQQQIFKNSTEITKLEQTQLFAKKRKQQIQSEQQSIMQQNREHQDSLDSLAQQLVLINNQLLEQEPNAEMLEESIFSATDARDNAEDALQQFNSQYRESEQQFNSLKQRSQQSHAQIQSTLSMQSRTEQRISEIEQEIEELSDPQTKQSLLTLSEHIQALEDNLVLLESQALDVSARQEVVSAEYENTQQQISVVSASLLKSNAKIEALQHVQLADDNANEQYTSLKHADIKLQPLWQYLNIKKGHELLFEVTLQHWSLSQVVCGIDINGVPPSFFASSNGAHLLLEPYFTKQKPANSLATYANNDILPSWLTQIIVVESFADAMAMRTSLLPEQSMITPDGVWLGKDWIVNGMNDTKEGVIARAVAINELKAQYDTDNMEHDTLLILLSERKSTLDTVNAQCQVIKEEATDIRNRLGQYRTDKQMLHIQSQQRVEREQRLLNDKNKQSLQSEQEHEQLNMLNEQLEEIAMQLVEYEDIHMNASDKREQLQTTALAARNQVEQLSTQKHQVDLALQTIRSNRQRIQEQSNASERSLQQNLEKQALLIDELEELSMPIEEQSERLQTLLLKQESLTLEQQQKNSDLAEASLALQDAEKGQIGIQQKNARITAELESLKLENNGYQVRASSYLEQLDDMQQALKPILESLPEDASDAVWQKELEKISNSISRLGAVNLAAVQEYEVQSERKAHLDAQNDDLVGALDTLESAIRKIDKETRTRFRATFDQINGDLSLLFPKVFGGGSAYLDLTDEDMLDTGVTIMARPPGKKNSTIHLLSGGEKALTALSLVFAIFRLNPAPFCLLDEVDAPLDDANVVRFCNLVSEMSKTVQFIYITHNKVAMEMASHLTGVTMGEPGVSRMVSVDVEEALAIAE